MTYSLNLQALIPKTLSNIEEAKGILDILKDPDLSIVPDKWGHYEPLKTDFDSDAILNSWSEPFLWTKKKPQIDGSIWMSPTSSYQHSSFTMRTSEAESESQLTKTVAELSIRFSVDFGYIHPVCFEQNLADAGVLTPLNREKSDFELFVTTHELKRYIPDLYWVTVFGPPYVRLMSQDRLHSSPAYLTRELGNGSIMIQLTESPADFVPATKKSEDVREKVKNHLGRDYFFNSQLGVSGSYVVPEFNLGDVRY